MQVCNYFDSTFYTKYTPLTEEEILKALDGSPAPGGVNEGYERLDGQSLKLALDKMGTLEYAFHGKTLIFSENGSAPAEAPFGVRTLDDIVLFTHLVPGTLRAYGVIADLKTGIVTVFELWFGGFEPARREVWRFFDGGYIDDGGAAPEGRHSLTNRIEGKGTHWVNDDGTEFLYFFPSVVWSSYVELSDPLGGITITAPSDFLKISDRYYVYSRGEQEYSGALTLEVIDLFTVRHVGMRLGFDKDDALVYKMYGGSGEITGQSTNLEPLTFYGEEIPYSQMHRDLFARSPRGTRPEYRPRFMHRDLTKEQVDEAIAKNLQNFEGSSIMSSFNTMEASDYMVGKTFVLRYDDGQAWEYRVESKSKLSFRVCGEETWMDAVYEGYEAAPDIVIFSHLWLGTDPLRCLTHAVDFSAALTTCVDAQLGNGRKPWQVGHNAIFGVLEMEGGPTPPAVKRHGFTTDLVGKAIAWVYGGNMQSIHVYSTPESYSWTIMMDKNAGGWMWSSPCLYVKLRDDAYLMSWTEDDCNGNQGTFVFNPRIMHDGGFFFGVGDHSPDTIPDIHLTPMGAYARPLNGFDILKYFK